MIELTHERIETINTSALITAAEFAFIEDAQATGSFLKSLIRLRTYLKNQGKSVALHEELSVLNDYIKLLSVRYINRFEFSPLDEVSGSCLYVVSGSVIAAFDKLFFEMIENAADNAPVAFGLSMVRAEACMDLAVDAAGRGGNRRIRICLLAC